MAPQPGERAAALNFLLGVGLLKAVTHGDSRKISFRAVVKQELDMYVSSHAANPFMSDSTSLSYTIAVPVFEIVQKERSLRRRESRVRSYPGGGK